MPVRDGMLQIIERVRELIGDESGVQFVNQRIQDVLDENARGDAWYLELRGQGTIMPGGTVRYYDFYAPVCPWDESASLYNGEYTALTGTLAPGTADYMRGYFNFAGSASPPYGRSDRSGLQAVTTTSTLAHRCCSNSGQVQSRRTCRSRTRTTHLRCRSSTTTCASWPRTTGRSVPP